MTLPLPQHIIDKIRECVEGGMSINETAKEVALHRNTVYNYCRQRKISGPRAAIGVRDYPSNRKTQEKTVIVLAVPPPPRRSMYALAAFDPVIARALRARLGLPQDG